MLNICSDARGISSGLLCWHRQVMPAVFAGWEKTNPKPVQQTKTHSVVYFCSWYCELVS